MTRASHQFISFSLAQGRFFAQKAKRYNYDLFLASLMAPARAQPSLQLILCVAHELARATRITSEPLLAMIRLTWWREAIEEIVAGSTPRAHELVQPLARIIEAEPEVARYLLEMIDAQATELEPEQWDKSDAWARYLRQGVGNILHVWGCVLHEEIPENMRMAAAMLDVIVKIPEDAASNVVRLATLNCIEAGLESNIQSFKEPSTELSFLCQLVINDAKECLCTVPERKLLRASQQILQSRIKRIEKYGCNPYDLRICRTPLSLYFRLLQKQIIG